MTMWECSLQVGHEKRDGREAAREAGGQGEAPRCQVDGQIKAAHCIRKAPAGKSAPRHDQAGTTGLIVAWEAIGDIDTK